MRYRVDPIFHAGITDWLPADHPLAYERVVCVKCGTLVHAFNNETMMAWFETGQGPICVDCMIVVLQECDGVLPDVFGLMRDAPVMPARGT